MGFFLHFRLCTGRKKFFWFFSQMSSFSTTLSLQNELLNSHEQFFSQWYGHIKFWHLSKQPYEHSYWLFGAYHSAFENLSWKFVPAGFDGLWIRIYSQNIDISISKMANSKWRIELYEIKRFCSLKTLTRFFRNCWLRKWNSKIYIFICKMAGCFKMANWNSRGKQYWSLKFCTWVFWVTEYECMCTICEVFSVYYEGQLSWVNLLV